MMILEIWHRIAKMVTVSVLEDMRLHSSLGLYYTIIVILFGLNPLSYRHEGFYTKYTKDMMAERILARVTGDMPKARSI